jgi:beta-glucosidase
VVTPLAGLRAAAPDIRLAHTDGNDLAVASALAARSDAALVVVGLDWRHEGEHIHPGDLAPILGQAPPPEGLLRLVGRRRLLPLWSRLAAAAAQVTRLGSARAGGAFASGDRTRLQLPADQEALILAVAAANPRTVVVLMGGGAILCEAWRQRVPGLLLLWYPGQRGGEALADVLLGRVSPSGRMPYAVPTDASHLPPFDPRARQITYDLWHGYRRLGRQRHPAAFPFGFGLSYSSFSHSDPEAQLLPGALELRLTVANTGTMDAAEVLQIYAEPPGQSVERPRRSLVGFRRLSLQPGQSERVAIQIPLRRLAWFDASRDAFVLEGGAHRLVAARHAEDQGIGVDLTLEAGLAGH